MRRFLLQTSFISLILLGVILFVFSLANGYTDPFYVRFTTPKQSSLILGTSRAAQGIQPRILKKELGKDVSNYAFTLGHSPYGPTYLESIKRKLNDNEKGGIFIITVDPWSVSTKDSNPNDSLNFVEKTLCVGNTKNVHSKPNFEYLYKNLKGKYSDILYYLLYPQSSGMFLHDDGWLEVTIKTDSVILKKNLEERIDDYKKNMQPFYNFSSYRFNYLKKTVEYLSNYGTVFLVRLPIHPRMYDIEQGLMPDFNSKIIKEILPFAEGYYDMTEENDLYIYNDGNHLQKSSGEKVTEKIAHFIKNPV